MGLLPRLFSVWHHPQQSSHPLSGPAFVYISNRYHTPAALMPLLTKPCAAMLPFTTNTTYDVAISPFCLLSLMVRGFSSHRTWVGIVMLSFSGSDSSSIFDRPSVRCPMYCTRHTACIFTLLQDSSSSTSTTPLLTVLTAVMMISQYRRAISAVAFWCVIAMIAPLAFLLALMILIWAGACWWKCALLIADAISWSTLLRSGTLLSPQKIRRLSAMVDPVIGVGPGPGPGPADAF